jgi:murein DD-endopeptidase MepM/ murein hydrolase activator NlpD
MAAVLSGCASKPQRAVVPAFRTEPPAQVHPSLWPLEKRDAPITSPFGMRKHPITGEMKMHKGVDIVAPPGTAVYATADGTVAFSGEQRGYGHIVVVRHSPEYETAYAHLRKRRVGEGERVRRGQVIGDVGRTGTATTDHLQYEVRRHGQPVDPMPYLPQQTAAR